MTDSKKRGAPQQVLRGTCRGRVRESGRGTRMERSSRVTHGCHRSLKRDEKKLRRGAAYAPSGHHYMVISASPSLPSSSSSSSPSLFVFSVSSFPSLSLYLVSFLVLFITGFPRRSSCFFSFLPLLPFHPMVLFPFTL